MSNWITGKELMARWNIPFFEFIDYLRQGLQAYSSYAKKKIQYSDIYAISDDRLAESLMNPVMDDEARKIMDMGSNLAEYFDSLPKTSDILTEAGAKQVIGEFSNHLFKKEDILEFENNHPELKRANEQKQADQEPKLSRVQMDKAKVIAIAK
ncbi:MAG: hypothetical protein HY730_01995 [Candidatus Tectomicrobia bacterium]|uniref:Uncharacterized protein n=1 Tax=Tectimicrobiota bacterium TaxID=2528274 RepID=A0A933GLT6_UNCTE|nr:hypothetical protein [Candidatus Tectomicrobia bacterium]